MAERQTQVLKDIKDLIFEQGTLLLPELGRFVGQYQSAVIDPLQGQVSPPALILRFDTSDVVDDGFFLGHIQKKYNLSMPTAAAELEALIAQIKAAFDKNELFVIPEVGRLYRDSAHNIQFYPDNTNFNTASFGLPSVAFYPISRPKSAEIPPAPLVVEAETVPPLAAAELPPPMPVADVPATVGSRWPALQTAHKPIWLTLSLVALVVVALCFNYLGQQNSDPVPETVHAAAPPALVNTPPIHKISPDSLTQIATEDYMSRSNVPSDESKATLQPQMFTAIILIGGFKDKANIARLNRWTRTQGYEVYEKKVGAVTRVGSVVPYHSKAELQQILKRFKAKYGAEVAIVKS